MTDQRDVATGSVERRGLFLVFEGIEGSGKSTQARRLADWLEEREVPCTLTREPGGTSLGEGIRRLLLESEDVPDRTELLLMLAARTVLVERVVRPVLERGGVVISDRYDLSTLAYQGFGRQLPLEEVRRLNRFATAGVGPDLTLVLDVPPSVGEARRRAAGGEADRIERAGSRFHERVAEAYRLLSREEAGVERIDGVRSPDEVHAEIIRRLRGRFPETFAASSG